MLSLYKIPGVFVVGFSGRFGVGKTLSMVEQGLKFADKLQLNIASNFVLNDDAVKKYCRFAQLNWFLDNGVITYCPSVSELLSQSDSLLLLDEGGVELFSRDFKKTDKNLFDRLFRIRHFGNFLFYSCQLPSQVDKQFRDMTHLWLHCSGFQKFHVPTRRSKLYSRSTFAYSPAAYLEYIESPNIEYSKFRRFFLCQFRFSFSFFHLKRKLYSFARYFVALKTLVILKNSSNKNFILHLCFFKSFQSKCFFIDFPLWLLHYIYKYYPRILTSCELLVDEDYLFACFDSFAARSTTRISAPSNKPFNISSLVNASMQP